VLGPLQRQPNLAIIWLECRSRIKRLRGLTRPQCRLRVDEIRVFYDISGDVVEILAIVPKQQAAAWLASAGELNEKDGPV
jgi:mRNA interferase RelE/StbE